MDTTRRSFLRQTGLIATAGVVGLPASAAAAAAAGVAAAEKIPPPAPSPMKIGLVTYNLAKDWDLPTLITHCEATGFQGVELRTTHAHKVEVNLSAAQRTEVRQRFADSRVELFGLGSAFDYHTTDQAQLRRDIDATKEYVKLSADVGGSGVKVRPNGLPEGVPVQKTLEQIGRSLRELGIFAADHGQMIRLEVHGAGTSYMPHIRTIMDVADHPQVGVCWNSNQTDLQGGFDASFEKVRSRIVAVHMRDLFLEEYPWRRLMTALTRSGYRGYCLAEIPESSDPQRVMRYYRALWLAYQGLL